MLVNDAGEPRNVAFVFVFSLQNSKDGKTFPEKSRRRGVPAEHGSNVVSENLPRVGVKERLTQA